MVFESNDDLQRAIALIQAGRPDEARPLLEAIVAADPTRELAWMWLATVATERDERIRYLERVLALNPQNETARTAYARLTGGEPPAPPPAAPPPASVAPGGGFRPATLLILMAVIAIGVTAVLIALYLRDDAESESDATPAVTLAAPITLSPTSAYSPTPSNTPRPTDTPGPSPTLVWDGIVPTWTEEPSATPAPTQRIATWTPRPPTETPTEPPPTPTETPGATNTRAPSQTPTRVATRTSEDAVTGRN